MVAEMTCYTYLGHIRNPRIYAVPPNNAVFTRFYFHPKNRVKWGEYCTLILPDQRAASAAHAFVAIYGWVKH